MQAHYWLGHSTIVPFVNIWMTPLGDESTFDCITIKYKYTVDIKATDIIPSGKFWIWYAPGSICVTTTWGYFPL